MELEKWENMIKIYKKAKDKYNNAIEKYQEKGDVVPPEGGPASVRRNRAVLWR